MLSVMVDADITVDVSSSNTLSEGGGFLRFFSALFSGGSLDTTLAVSLAPSVKIALSGPVDSPRDFTDLVPWELDGATEEPLRASSSGGGVTVTTGVTERVEGMLDGVSIKDDVTKMIYQQMTSQKK
ncbi:unnamed protein product [Clavelina lepadiformis]|uniref:Uncharacterized protein n=1 Tax=Clavelina lepadiformis TaxID=159417 RepID=A0ABP0FR77_CLALP